MMPHRIKRKQRKQQQNNKTEIVAQLIWFLGSYGDGVLLLID